MFSLGTYTNTLLENETVFSPWTSCYLSQIQFNTALTLSNWTIVLLRIFYHCKSKSDYQNNDFSSGGIILRVTRIVLALTTFHILKMKKYFRNPVEIFAFFASLYFFITYFMTSAVSKQLCLAPQNFYPPTLYCRSMSLPKSYVTASQSPV